MGETRDIRLSNLELDEEIAAKELSVAEKRVLIRQAKKKYGADWYSIISKFGGGGKGSGMNWNALKFRVM